MLVSVIIPTHNRVQSLRYTLESFCRQTLPADSFEVIVIDDGSTDDTARIQEDEFPFLLRYLYQANKGAAAARNLGAQESQSEFLVFTDDDVLVEPAFLDGIVREHGAVQQRIVIGVLYPWTGPESMTAVANNDLDSMGTPTFLDVRTTNVSVRRQEYYALGMMPSLGLRGPDTWCDVEFGYRAHLRGFEFRRSAMAVAYHRDYALQSFSVQCQKRWGQAKAAVLLLNKYPDLLPYLEMFHDKAEIDWSEDPAWLILRKVGRRLLSSRWLVAGMEWTGRALAAHRPKAALLSPLRRLILGAYIYQGFQEGIKAYGPAIALTRTGVMSQ